MTSPKRPYFAVLPHRAVLSLAGEDTVLFLQGLITGNVEELQRGGWLYAALLAPQGKVLFDFLLLGGGGGVKLDCERVCRDKLAKQLGFYRLRARVEIADSDDAVAVVWEGEGEGEEEREGERGGLPDTLGAVVGGQDNFAGGPDPRLPALGARFIGSAEAMRAIFVEAGFRETDSDEYQRYRLRLGVGEGAADLAPEGIFPLEGNLDLLNGIDFQKGCFIGQEVVSRTWRRGTTRKRLTPVTSDQRLPAPGAAIRAGDVHLGVLCSGLDRVGLALLRLDRLAQAGGSPVMADGVPVVPHRPDWMPMEIFTPGERERG